MAPDTCFKNTRNVKTGMLQKLAVNGLMAAGVAGFHGIGHAVAGVPLDGFGAAGANTAGVFVFFASFTTLTLKDLTPL